VARIRTIKPEFPHSESMGRVSRESRLCFILLWTIADDSGRLRGNSRMLASLLYPYDDDAKNKIDGWLTQLAGEGCIDRYEVDGTSYIQVAKWADHQKIDKPSQSRLPSFDEASRGFAKGSEDSTTDLGPRTMDLVPSTEDEFDAFWQTYPKKVGKPAAAKAFRSAKINGHLPNVLADIAAKTQSPGWQKSGGEFIPNPATYLNQRRWEDETASTGQQIPGLI